MPDFTIQGLFSVQKPRFQTIQLWLHNCYMLPIFKNHHLALHDSHMIYKSSM
uniref:Uncharacterized protein n=1 Tax=Octopus bimaculoides TaxID=37653 RepID=A0A0L8FR61_OCTBM